MCSTSTIPIPARLICDGGFTAGPIGGSSVPVVRPGPESGGFGARTTGLLGRPDETHGSMGGGTGEAVALFTGCGDVAADSAFTGGGRTLEPLLMLLPESAAFTGEGRGALLANPPLIGGGGAVIQALDAG